jgi:hypothetical protein
MPILVIQILGVLLFGVALWVGYRRWIQPRAATLSAPARRVLWLILVTLLGGGIGSPVWWFDMPWAFSWDLPPLAARLLAAAGWSFVVMSWITLEHPTRRRCRLILVLLALYLTPLLIAILLFHRDRFDFSAPITYVFFAIVLGMTSATLGYLLRLPADLPNEAPVASRPHPSTTAWLMLVATILLPWSAALFLTDRGPLAALWVWPGDLLSSRLIAVMLLTIGAGAIISLRDAQTARLLLAGMTTYGLAVTLAGMWNLLSGRPVPIIYVVVFCCVGIGSALLLRRAATTDSHPATTAAGAKSAPSKHIS